MIMLKYTGMDCTSRAQEQCTLRIMSDFAVVYFPRSKNADVVAASSVNGTCVVGETRRVRWHEKTYSAKIAVLFNVGI